MNSLFAYFTRLKEKRAQDKERKRVSQWRDAVINPRAHTVRDYFHGFKFIVKVSPYKFFNMHEPFGWIPCEDAKPFVYPMRNLEEAAFYGFFRCVYDQFDGWVVNEIGGGDEVFVATNNEQDAMMISLKFS